MTLKNGNTLISKKSIAFVCKDYFPILTHKTNIVLSPEFYWVIQKTLPVKYAWQARKLCPSLFDGILPPGDYTYRVFKKENHFLLFAYDNKKIVAFFQKANIDLSMINGLYFAQNELDKDKLFSIGDKVLLSEQGIVLMLPRHLVSEDVTPLENLDSLKLSTCKIHLDRYALPIDKNTFRFLVTILSVLTLLNGFAVLIQQLNDNALEQTKSSLYAKYHLPTTSLQIESMRKKAYALHAEQLKLRDKIEKVLLNAGEHNYFLTHLSLDKNIIKCVFHNENPNEIQTIRQKFEKFFTVKSATVNNNTVIVELLYE